MANGILINQTTGVTPDNVSAALGLDLNVGDTIVKISNTQLNDTFKWGADKIPAPFTPTA